MGIEYFLHGCRHYPSLYLHDCCDRQLASVRRQVSFTSCLCGNYTPSFRSPIFVLTLVDYYVAHKLQVSQHRYATKVRISIVRYLFGLTGLRYEDVFGPSVLRQDVVL